MAEPNRFTLIFEKLDEATAAERPAPRIEWVGVTTELEEIAELAELAAAMREPEPMSYTIA